MTETALTTIETAIGKPPFEDEGSYTDGFWFANDRNIRTWLMLKGVSSKGASTASRESLRKAYSHSSYLAGWLRREQTGRKPQRNVDIDFDDERPGLNAALDELPDTLPALPAPATNGQAISQQDMDAFANVVSRLIDQKISKTNDSLRLLANAQLTEGRVKQLISETKISLNEDSKNQIRDLARSAALALVDQMVPHCIEIRQVAKPTISLGAEPRHKVFAECLQWLLSGESVYLVGPAGTGKTHMARQLADALGKRFLPVPKALTKYEFSGFIDAGGSYRGTIVRDAIENGGLLVIDEIDSFAAAAVMFLNSVMANGYCAFPDRVVQKHEHFQVIAAANTYGRGATREYVGRNPLDAASLDRFAYVECDYDQVLERQLFGESPWLAYVHKCRAACETLNQHHILSMRAIERGLRGLAAGLTTKQVVDAALWRGLALDTIAKIENLAGKFIAGVNERKDWGAEAPTVPTSRTSDQELRPN
jgi:cobaltochelatase CobS